MVYSPDFLRGLLPEFFVVVFSLDFDVGLLPEDQSEALTRRKIILIEGNAKSCHVTGLCGRCLSV